MRNPWLWPWPPPPAASQRAAHGAHAPTATYTAGASRPAAAAITEVSSRPTTVPDCSLMVYPAAASAGAASSSEVTPASAAAAAPDPSVADIPPAHRASTSR